MDIIRNLYMHKYSHKMFYKTKPASSSSSPSASRQANGNATVTSAQNNRSQAFYIYSIDQTIGRNMPPLLDLPPKYEDCVKDPPPYSSS